MVSVQINVCHRHMKEHLKEEIGNINKDMTPEEMEFHYFR